MVRNLMNGKVLVLGASGLVGSHVVKALAVQNRDIRIFTRKTSNISAIKHLDFEHAYDRKEILSVNHYQIYLAAIDDLITLKKTSGRESDLVDVENLEKLREFRNEGK